MSPKSSPPRWQRERKRIHILYVALGTAIILSLGIVGYGYYSERQEDYELHHRPALRVNGTVLNIDDFTEKLKRSGIQGAKDMQQMSLILESTITQMQNEELIRQAMDRYDIPPPTKKEIDEEIREMVGEENYKKAVKNKDLRRMAGATLRQWKLRDYLGKDKILPQEQSHVRGIWVGIKEEVEEVISRLNKDGEDFAHLAQELSQDEASKDKGGDMGWLPKGIWGDDFDRTVFDTLEVGEVSGLIFCTDFAGAPQYTQGGYWVLKAEDKMVYVLGILVGGKGEAEEVIKRVEEGEEFSSLASELSLDSSRGNGGNLGWKGEDYEFFDAVFSLEKGKISPPLSTPDDGYWVLKAEDKMVYVLGILVGGEGEAEEVIKRVEEGEEFSSLASELSLDSSKGNGGNLGWKGENYKFFDNISTPHPRAMVGPIFDPDCSKLGGYCIVEVLEQEERRELEHDMQEVIKGKAINDWIEKERKEATLEIYLDDELMYFALENL